MVCLDFWHIYMRNDCDISILISCSHCIYQFNLFGSWHQHNQWLQVLLCFSGTERRKRTHSAPWTAPHTPAETSHLLQVNVIQSVCCRRSTHSVHLVPTTQPPVSLLVPAGNQISQPKHKNCWEWSCLMLSVSPLSFKEKLGTGLNRRKPPCRFNAAWFSSACLVKEEPERRTEGISPSALSLNL